MSFFASIIRGEESGEARRDLLGGSAGGPPLQILRRWAPQNDNRFEAKYFVYRHQADGVGVKRH